MIVNPTKWIEPCKNNGQCANIRIYQITSIPKGTVDFSGTTGRSAVAFVKDETGTEKYNTDNQIEFRCCNSCHQPINMAEANRLNGECGFELPKATDLTARLKAMKERLSLNNGQPR